MQLAFPSRCQNQLAERQIAAAIHATTWGRAPFVVHRSVAGKGVIPAPGAQPAGDPVPSHEMPGGTRMAGSMGAGKTKPPRSPNAAVCCTKLGWRGPSRAQGRTRHPACRRPEAANHAGDQTPPHGRPPRARSTGAAHRLRTRPTLHPNLATALSPRASIPRSGKAYEEAYPHRLGARSAAAR